MCNVYACTLTNNTHSRRVVDSLTDHLRPPQSTFNFCLSVSPPPSAPSKHLSKADIAKVTAQRDEVQLALNIKGASSKNDQHSAELENVIDALRKEQTCANPTPVPTPPRSPNRPPGHSAANASCLVFVCVQPPRTLPLTIDTTFGLGLLKIIFNPRADRVEIKRLRKVMRDRILKSALAWEGDSQVIIGALKEETRYAAGERLFCGVLMRAIQRLSWQSCVYQGLMMDITPAWKPPSHVPFLVLGNRSLT